MHSQLRLIFLSSASVLFAAPEAYKYDITTPQAMYSEEGDLNALDLFVGDFTNWGFYEKTADGAISSNERLKASEDLYLVCARHLNLKPADKFLEISCGKGGGLCYLINEFHLENISAVDMSAYYLNHAQRHLPQVRFFQQDAQTLDLGTSYDKVLCLEAAQHFPNIDLFLQSVKKHLNPGGIFVLSTFFGNMEGAEGYATGVVTVEKGVDNLHCITSVQHKLTELGFRIQVHSIGKNVFPGYVKWALQVYPEAWNRRWLELWEQGVIDYYLIVAEGPSST